jgi:hypothetical protein
MPWVSPWGEGPGGGRPRPVEEFWDNLISKYPHPPLGAKARIPPADGAPWILRPGGEPGSMLPGSFLMPDVQVWGTGILAQWWARGRSQIKERRGPPPRGSTPDLEQITITPDERDRAQRCRKSNSFLPGYRHVTEGSGGGGEGTRLTAHQAALAVASASRRSSDENLEAFRLLTLQARDRGVHDPAQGIHTEGLR